MEMDPKKKQYLDHLHTGLKKHMDAQEKDAPTVRLRCKLVSTESKSGSHVYSLRVVSASRKMKVSKALGEEQKMFIQTPGGPLKCTIVGVDGDVVRAVGHRRLKGYDFEVLLDQKHNNQVLLDHLERFMESGKDFNNAISESWRGREGPRIHNGDACMAKGGDTSEAAALTLYDSALNESQRSAVEMVRQRTPYKILGPPGTGKTRTVVEIISQLLASGNKVLVCGPSNVSVDNIIERFVKSQHFAGAQPSFYRLGSSVKGLTHLNLESQAESHTMFMKEEKNDRGFHKDKKERQRRFVEDKQSSSPVVFATLFSSLKEKRGFDWVLVDEACQASEVESFLAVAKGSLFILIGDPMQLCPETPSLYKSLDLPTVLLNEQYRMPEGLLRFSNEVFYGGRVKSAMLDHIPVFGHSPILFVDTHCFEVYETGGVSKSNAGEAEIVRGIVDVLRGEEVGIIAPYTSQVLLLRDMVNVEVSTVDGFQGQERDYIILTLVRSNDRGEFGFLDDEKRLNVALTRCRRGLVVVGDSGTLRRSRVFQRLFSFLRSSSMCLDPESLKDFIEQRNKDKTAGFS